MKLGLMTAIREDTNLFKEFATKRSMANLGPLYLASYLKAQGIGVEVYIKDSVDDLIDLQPDILGISSVTENIEYAKTLAERARKTWNPLIILGGVHITALPRTLPAIFDIGVVGEGEETFSELVGYFLKNGSTLNTGDLSKILGIVLHGPQGPILTGPRKGLDPLDQIPHPDRKRYVQNIGMPYIMTSRGCPYSCDFCTIPQTSVGYRTHTPEYVIEEIKFLKKDFPKIKRIVFFDDLFIVDRRRVEKIARLIDSEGLNRDLSFVCWGRANLIDEKMIKIFKKMNMVQVSFGAESGSSRVMSKIKPGSSVELNQRAIDVLSMHGIAPFCSFLLGHPEETEDDLWATYKFIERNADKLFEVELNVAVPWPGTALWVDAKRRGIVADDMDFNTLREAACIENYVTDLYPYINENIQPERFDIIMAEFKKLHRKILKNKEKSSSYKIDLTIDRISKLY